MRTKRKTLGCSEFRGKRPESLPQKSCDVGLRCEKSACLLRSSDAKCLRFGLSLRGLRCERQCHDAKSLAMWVERFEPLGTGLAPTAKEKQTWTPSLVLLKAQLGEAFLEIFVVSFLLFCHGKTRHLRTQNRHLRGQNRHLSVQTGT